VIKIVGLEQVPRSGVAKAGKVSVEAKDMPLVSPHGLE
jgi:hypothetical protein